MKLLILFLQAGLQPAYGQVGIYAGQYLGSLKGLGDIIYPTNREGTDLIQGFGYSADKNDRDIVGTFISLQPFANLVAIHVGHLDIQQNQVRRFRLGRGQGHSTI